MLKASVLSVSASTGLRPNSHRSHPLAVLYTSMLLHTHLPRLISSILSLLQATGLRNRVYAMEDRLDILEVAVEDIERINANSPKPNPLITSICSNVRKHKDTIGQYLD